MVVDPTKVGPEAGRVLFDRLRKQCDGFNRDAVRDAAGNLILNAMRQTYGTWREAETEFNEHYGRMKQALKDHYDNVTGRRHSLFPYTQVIDVPKMDFSGLPKFPKPYGQH